MFFLNHFYVRPDYTIYVTKFTNSSPTSITPSYYAHLATVHTISRPSLFYVYKIKWNKQINIFRLSWRDMVSVLTFFFGFSWCLHNNICYLVDRFYFILLCVVRQRKYFIFVVIFWTTTITTKNHPHPMLLMYIQNHKYVS